MDAFRIRTNQARIRREKRKKIFGLISFGLVLSFILFLVTLTLETVATRTSGRNAMDFPNEIMRGSASLAAKLGKSLWNSPPALREDSSITNTKDSVPFPQPKEKPPAKKIYRGKEIRAS